MSEHTPGRWSHVESGGRQEVNVEFGDGTYATLAELRSLAGFRPYWEAAANARLIAAAPELLEVCESLIRAVGVNGVMLPSLSLKARAAIAKARGEGVITG